MSESKQYQFRAGPDLEAKMRSVWLKGETNTDNLIRIIWAGVQALKKGGA